ncbi:transporter [Geobacter pickeringii]|uniref:Transporter n=1 Tax=Geobacter pickeringii TaxID=345632 RepID=A0A0B5BLF5_9BACT|nr:transporter [Geobacter pickeringii]
MPLRDNLKDKYPLLVLAVLCLAALYVVSSLSSIFMPVLLALVLAYVLNPLVGLLERRRVPRLLAIAVVLVGIAVLCLGAVFFFATAVQQEVASVQINLPEYADRLYGLIPHEVKVFLGIETQEKLSWQINRAVEALRGVSLDLAREAFVVVKKAFASTLSFVLTVAGYLITPVYLFYFLADLPRFRGNLMELVPERARGKVSDMAGEIDDILSAFVRGQLSVCAILAVLYSIGLFLVGIDLAVVIGSLSGILFIIPYAGTVFGIVVSMVMAFLKFHDVLHPLLCLGWFGIVQAIEGGVITPAVVGTKVGLHPVVALLALFIGGQWFGIFGMLLAVPVAAVLKVFLRSLHSWYLSSSYYRGA